MRLMKIKDFQKLSSFNENGLFLLMILILGLVFVEAQEDMFAREVTSEDFEEEEVFIEKEIIEDRAGITPDSPLYVVDTFIDDIALAMKTGEAKAEYALKLNEEKIAEAKLMADEDKIEATKSALKNANKTIEAIQSEVSPDMENLTKETTEFVNSLLKDIKAQLPDEDWEEVNSLINDQMTQAEKNVVAVEIAGKIADLCEQLAMQDYSLMEQEPRCDPDSAPEWLKDFIATEVQQREEEAAQMVVEQITTCIMDPRECDCSQIPVESHRVECEQNTALAIRCEFEEDMSACDELEGKEPEIPSNLPPFLRDIMEDTFTELIAQKESQMFAKFAPPECIDAGATTREECEAIMIEVHGPPPEECMEDGKFIGEDECMAIMIESGEIPEECVRDGRPISREECEAIMIEKYMPQECIDAGATTREECEAIMIEKMGGEMGEMPPECEGLSGEECGDIMMEKMGGEMGEMPPECEGLSGEECEAAMMERGLGIPPGEIPGTPMERPAGFFEEPREDLAMGEIFGEGFEEDMKGFDEFNNMQSGKKMVIGEDGFESISEYEIENIIREKEKAGEKEVGLTNDIAKIHEEIETLEGRTYEEPKEETSERDEFGEEPMEEFGEKPIE